MDVLTTPPLPLHDWLLVVQDEYLAGFIPSGGAAVKLAILDDGAFPAALAGLSRLAAENGLVIANIDAARTRIHLIHELFFAIAAALPWDSLLQRYLEELFSENAYPWPRPNEAMALPDLANAFGVAAAILSRNIDRWLTENLWGDPRLAQDFRAAMLSLCLARLQPEGAAAADPVLRWLRGEKVPAADLRASDISVRISRANARPMLTSLCHFLRKAAAPGLLLVLDVRHLSVTAPAAGQVKYAPAAVMDSYEVLREIIDDAEHLPGLFVAVLADAALATGDPRRALSQYAALQMRVWPDVRPGGAQNPVAPLVWLSA